MASIRSSGAKLSADEVTPLLAEALARWHAAGVDTSDTDDGQMQIADLLGTMLGMVSANTIYIDINAAGRGWFVDSTPSDDSEFTTPGNQGEQGRIDLLTVLMHEVGRLLRYDHVADGVMAETLAKARGRRRRALSTRRMRLCLCIRSMCHPQAVGSALKTPSACDIVKRHAKRTGVPSVEVSSTAAAVTYKLTYIGCGRTSSDH